MVKANLAPELAPEEIYRSREELGIHNSISMLTEIIDTNKEDKLRNEAIIYLGKITHDSDTLKEQCFETFENLLISDDNIDIKCSAAKVLGKMRYEKALKPLKWVIEQESINDKIKEESLRAIAKIRFDEPEIKLFIEELNNKNPSIKTFIKNQLINLNPEEVIKLLLISLEAEDFSKAHKAEIINLIGFELSSINVSFEDSSFLKIKYPDLFSQLIRFKKILLEHITSLTIQDHTELMNNSLAILKTLGDEIYGALIKLLLKDDFLLKMHVIKLIGKLRLTDAVEFLIVNLDNMYNEVSIASIEALGEIGDLSAVPDLINVLNIEDISYEFLDLDMKFYILDAVKNIYLSNKNASFEYLYSLLETKNNTIKESVAYILGEIECEEFVQPLINLLKEKNLDVKKNSIIALGKIGSLEALDSLIKKLEDINSYWIIKKVAVDAIYNIYQKNSYLLKQERKESKRMLTKYTTHLIDHLSNQESEDFKVKLSLIKFLEDFGGPAALNALMSRVNDFHRVVRIHASNAIKKIEEKLELESS